MLEQLPQSSAFRHKVGVLANLIAEHLGAPSRMLVLGCGSGVEAAELATQFGSEVFGIDLLSHFDAAAARVAKLRRGDATDLDFPDAFFDQVYSYHALEHIPDYRGALGEMRRVLRPGGGYCIGTPNRSRLIGYIGSTNASLRNKIGWNLNDWKCRLRGRFRNEFGAHAGFTKTELSSELRSVFGEVEDITLAYYTRVYSGHARAVRGMSRLGLAPFLFPSIYFVGTLRPSVSVAPESSVDLSSR